MAKKVRSGIKVAAVREIAKPASAWKEFWFPACLIVLIAFVVYIPSITSGFMWDDDVMLTNNALMKDHDGLSRIWFSTELSDYFPLTSTSFWIEWRLWGMNPVGYNITNILLHGFSSVLVWRIFRRLSIPGAWLAAAVFAIHPVCVASVDWIAERKNTLSMLFYAGSLLAFLDFEQSGKRQKYWLALGLFLLALLSKTSVVILPFILLLCAWWQRNQIRKIDLLRVTPFFMLSLMLGLVTVWFQLHEVLAGEAPETDTFLTRVLGGNRALWFYLGKDLFPVNLCYIYPQWTIDPAKWSSYAPGILWLSALATFWRFRQTWGRPLLFAMGCFTCSLLPVLGFIDMNFLLFTQVADHLQYLAVPVIAALMVGLAAKYGPRLIQSALHQRIAMVVALLVFSMMTWQQVSIYKDKETIWRDTVKKNPTAWIAHHNLADTLVEQHRFEEAAICYRRALRYKPTYAKTHNNLGNTLNLLGEVDEAIDQFLDAIQYKPEMAEAHHNLAVQYFGKGDYGNALAEYQKAMELKPNYAPAYFGAGNCALKTGDIQAALDYFFSGLRYNPDSADAHYVVGLILKTQGEKEAAMRQFRNTVRINPTHEARNELILLSDGDEESPFQGG